MNSAQGLLAASLLVAMVWLAAGQLQNDEVKHLMVNDANLIETQKGFAVMAPILASHDWKAVNVNGDQVQAIAANCQVTNLSKQSMASAPAQQVLLDNAIKFLRAAESNPAPSSPQYQIYRTGSASFSLRGNTVMNSVARNIFMSSFSSNGISLNKYDDDNMSIQKLGLPNNINRIFIAGDVVTFVYNDGRVLMRPFVCMQPDEQQLVQSLKGEVLQAQSQFQAQMKQSSQNLQQNMQHMRQNLQQNMQQMRHNMNNIFNRNNFPFNSNSFADDSFFQNHQFGQQLGGGFGYPPMQQQQFQQQQNFGYPQQQFQGFGQAPQTFQQSNYASVIPQIPGLGAGLSAIARAGRAAAASIPYGHINSAIGPFSSQFQFGGR